MKGDSRVKVSGNSQVFVETLVAVAKSSAGTLTTVIPRPCSLKLRTVVTAALALATLAISPSVPVAAKKMLRVSVSRQSINRTAPRQLSRCGRIG